MVSGHFYLRIYTVIFLKGISDIHFLSMSNISSKQEMKISDLLSYVVDDVKGRQAFEGGGKLLILSS